MRFLKDNSTKISRLIITHIAMSVFGLALFFSTNVMEPHEIMLAASIFSVVFYAVIVYTTMWDFGIKDKPAFDAGRLNSAAKVGFFSVFFAEVIWMILAISYVIVFQFDVNFASIIYVVEFLTSCCFTGIEVYIKNNILADGSILTPYIVASVYVLGSIIISAIGTLGYVLGTKDITIIPKKQTTKK
ncbi:MAG: hypothetical protein IJN48_04355 [Clostridia bacterium]|nr:hypothetical protein [Clostridia bacterium]